MFVVAAASNEGPVHRDFPTLFVRWIRASDLSNRRFRIIRNSFESWGWVGIAGLDVEEYTFESNGSLLVHGVVLNPDLQSKPLPGREPSDYLKELRESEGQFVYAYLKSGEGSYFECGTDPLSIRPVYVNDLQKPSVMATSVSLCGLLSRSCTLNFETALEFAVRDSIQPTRTVVTGVSRLPRGRVVRVEDHALRVYETNRALTTRNVSLEEACDALKVASTRLLRSDKQVLLGLTGGKDSRLVLAGLFAAGTSFETATHSHPCMDSTIAERLAEFVGVRHWNIGQSHGDTFSLVAKYLSLLPFTEGLNRYPRTQSSSTVHDLADIRGMVHVGGLGGGVMRAYWDPADAGFRSPAEAIRARYFRPMFKPLFRPEDLERAERSWLGSVEDFEGIDEFASLQLTLLERKLRAVIGARSNAADYAFSWPLANRTLYAFALSKPRAYRQGNIFEDMIHRLNADLLSIPWNEGQAGDFGALGLRGKYRKVRASMSQYQLIHMLRGSFRNTSTMPEHVLVSRYFVRHYDEWIRQLVPDEGMSLLRSSSRSLENIILSLINLYLFDLYLQNLRSDSRAGVWFDESMLLLNQMIYKSKR